MTQPESGDDDRIEPPVSNEELYVAVSKTTKFVYSSLSVVLLAVSYAAFSTGTEAGVSLGLSLIVGAAWILFRTFATWYNGWANSLYELIPSKSVDETIVDMEERLTDSARADGGDDQ